MGRYEDEVREEMARAADTARGLGMSLGVDDMRYFADELGYAAMADARAQEDEWYREEAERNARLLAELEAERGGAG
jgi:hypothetical protein